MTKYITITEAEKKVLEVLWKLEYALSNIIYAELTQLCDWSRNTTKVYLNRLVEKELAGVDKKSARKHYYYPLLSEKEFLADETNLYINDHYDKLSHMFAGLMDTNKVTDEDIDEIQSLISSYKSKGK